MREVVQRLEAKAGEEQERLKQLCHFWEQQILQLETTTKAVVHGKTQEVSEKFKKIEKASFERRHISPFCKTITFLFNTYLKIFAESVIVTVLRFILYIL